MDERFTVNEPTTGEIVSALRNCPNCDDCLRKDQKCYRNDHDAADRLESQERELSGITGELERFRAFHERYAEQTSKKYIDDICALTDRAESAERERDAAIADLKFLDRCKTCFHAKTRHLIGSECKTCKALSNFKWRGLPQDGEGV